MPGERGWSAGCCLGAAGEEVGGQGLAVSGWEPGLYPGGGEVTKGVEGKHLLLIMWGVGWERQTLEVEGGCQAQGRLPAGGPASGFVRDPGPGLPDSSSLRLHFLE